MKRLRPTVAPTPENMAVDRMLTKHQQAFGRAYLAGDFLATTSDEDFAILLEIGSIDAKELDAKSPKAQTLLLLTIHLIDTSDSPNGNQTL